MIDDGLLFFMAAIVGFMALIGICSGCTPRTGLEHEYHVASITINGEVTETDFKLCRRK